MLAALVAEYQQRTATSSQIGSCELAVVTAARMRRLHAAGLVTAAWVRRRIGWALAHRGLDIRHAQARTGASVLLMVRQGPPYGVRGDDDA